MKSANQEMATLRAANLQRNAEYKKMAAHLTAVTSVLVTLSDKFSATLTHGNGNDAALKAMAASISQLTLKINAVEITPSGGNNPNPNTRVDRTERRRLGKEKAGARATSKISNPAQWKINNDAFFATDLGKAILERK